MFASTALAVQSLMLESDTLKPALPYLLNASGEDPESLLINWLNEVIYYIETKRVAFSRIDIHTFSDGQLAAHAWGEPIDPARHRMQLVVKAATWHQLRLAQENGQWVAEVYLDI